MAGGIDLVEAFDKIKVSPTGEGGSDGRQFVWRCTWDGSPFR